ncbi:hypothetical protein DFH09DRAFT_1067856 [Mycena vulgaris]|nr:hypothetical protein DFH09DRAFT_1067856 [Mycena vulgaris]
MHFHRIDSCYDGGSSKPTRTQLQAFKKTHDIDDTIPGPEARFILSEQCSARGDIGRRDLGASGLNGIGGRLRRRWGCGIRGLPSFWVQSGFMYEVGVKKTLRGTHLILRHLELDSLNTDEPPAIESDAEDTDFLCQSLLCGIQRWILGAPSATFTSEFWHSGFWTILQLLRQPKTAGVFPASGARAMSAEWDKLIPTIYTPALLNSFLATISAHAAIPGRSAVLTAVDELWSPVFTRAPPGTRTQVHNSGDDPQTFSIHDVRLQLKCLRKGVLTITTPGNSQGWAVGEKLSDILALDAKISGGQTPGNLPSGGSGRTVLRRLRIGDKRVVLLSYTVPLVETKQQTILNGYLRDLLSIELAVHLERELISAANRSDEAVAVFNLPASRIS